MTYPVSSDVIAGQPTASAHYNNLRADALRLGAAAADSANVGEVLARFENCIALERLSTDRVRVPGSSARPASLVIDGVPVRSVANVDLPSGGKPTGGAALWYVFAVRSAGASVFTLEVNTSATESAGKRCIGSFYWTGTKIELSSIRTVFGDYIKGLLSLETAHLCTGRLTLSSGAAVSADVATSGSVYFTPFRGAVIALYVYGGGWRLFPFAELTLSLGGIAANKNVDVFVYDNAGVLTLDGVEWTDATSRAVNIVLQDGVYCKDGALDYRYVGTVRTSGAGVSSDTVTKRLCWNAQNRVRRKVLKQDNTASWTASTGAWRALNGSTWRTVLRCWWAWLKTWPR